DGIRYRNVTGVQTCALPICCINEMKDRPFEEITFTSAESIPGKSGVVSSTFKSGLTVPEELLNLYEVFKENNITPYIVSASPRRSEERRVGKGCGHSLTV